jgi:peptidoglycan/LPS O-acetylase OafA/YrhL
LWNTPAWSLSVEAFFYATFPFIAPALMRLSRPACVAGIAICWFLASTHLGLDLLPGGLGSNPDVDMFPLVRLPEFALGILIARIYQLHREDVRLIRFAPFLTGGAALLILCVTAVSSETSWQVKFGTDCLPLLFAGLVMGLALDRRWLSVLTARPLVLLGESSYALYLLHLGLAVDLAAVARAIPTLGDVVFAGWFLVVYLTAAIGLSMIVYVAIERPSRRAIRASLHAKIGPLPTLGVNESRTARA